MTSNEDITSLTALVQRMVDESGNPQGFDARAWLDHWLVRARPDEFPPRNMRTSKGLRALGYNVRIGV
ncbi:hypothetical protein RXE55_006836 [Pseudomonas aeruginosa]|nr:hypothetical protein [Pseudomonas aeruginosa]ELL4435729.1 hypothetical protein [Pseudomonas aeruginosa]